jgi:hypothetical protein
MEFDKFTEADDFEGPSKSSFHHDFRDDKEKL